ncbi:DUF4189 domain-containing protein [Acinetobacter higginsii]|uniref:DUF4189 domain-containing protein n=1 Tax=Acinetobacter higginsii TaxID=70347 RepID=UPI001F4B3504|nr:DUF4189 domain-containing protein [Acinetobacter higginsii]MCH7294311.1 DUF4189 domain-containing protein [Acinetobacter higginsii]
MFLGVCSSIYACPAGMVELPGGTCLPPDHQNSPLNNLPSASPPPVWADRWGAIATDNKTGSLGVSVDMKNKTKAQKAAIADCQAKGGKTCEVDIAYYNQCAAMVLGSKKYNTARAATKEKAIELGMQACNSEDGNKNCSVYYSGCSTAVRVN